MTRLRKMMLEELERRNYSQGTTRCYLRAIAEFARYFHRSPDQLRPEHVREYQAYLFRERKLDAGSVTQQVAALRFFFLKTLRKRWTMDETPYPKKVRRLPTVLSQEEVAQLVNAASTPFYRILLMTLYATGARCAEVARLQVGDIDSPRLVIHIRGGKGRVDRDVMLSPALLAALREHWSRLKPKVWLFPGGRWHTAPQPIGTKTLWHACYHAAQRAGRKKSVHPHTLRHYLPFLTMSCIRALDCISATCAKLA
jgi:site-specific recombinase XerD